MKKMSLLLFVLSLLLSGNIYAKQKLNIVVSILPQKYFVSQIVDNNVSIDVLVGANSSPHSFNPSPMQIAKLSNADIYFKIGLPFEDRILEKIKDTNKDLKIVNLRKNVPLIYSNSHHHENHRSSADPHIWMNPKLVMTIARTITDSLKNEDQANKFIYERNYSKFKTKLENLNNYISAELELYKGKRFFVYHPALAYYAKQYGIKEVPIEHEGKEPSAKYVVSIIKSAEKHNVKTLFVEPQFSKKMTKQIAKELGGKVEIINPLSEDYINNLKIITIKIKSALAISD